MSRLNSINLDFLKRPRVLMVIGAVVVILIAFYFAWWAPEGNKLSSIQTQKQAQSTKITTLQADLAQLRGEAHYVSQYQDFLTFFSSEVPVQPEEGQLVEMVGKLANQDKVTLGSMTDNTATAPAAVGQLGTIPVSIDVTGPHDNLLKFLNDLYNMPRLVTIQSANLTPTGGQGSNYDVLTSDATPFSMLVSGTAYYIGVVAPAS